MITWTNIVPLPDAADPAYLRHPAARAEAYVAAGLWGTRRIEDILLDTSRHSDASNCPAITAGGRTWTHAELAPLVDGVAQGLARAGIGSGTRVVLQLPNGLDVIAVTIALFRLGAVPVFALPSHRVTEIAHAARTARATVHILGDLPGLEDDAHRQLGDDVTSAVDGICTLRWPTGRAQACVVDNSVSEADPVSNQSSDRAAEFALPAPSAESLAFFQLSGGTTGPSKLIPRAHREYVYSFLRSADVCGFDAHTVLLPAIPLTHNFPMSSPGWMGVLAVGGHVVVPSSPDARAVGQAILAHRVTHVQAVPPLVHSWLDSVDFPAHRLTRILVGGARLAESVARRVHRELAPLQQVYGMAEGLVCYTPLDAPEDLIVSTQGQPMSTADEVRVIAADGRPAPSGMPGELQVRGPYTIPAYYRAGVAGETSFTEDGFYRTGDMVTRSDDGDLAVVGRLKEQINRGGEKISPAEVESLLLQHPGVTDVCVNGIPDDVLGERVEAHIVPRAGWVDRLDTTSLRRHLRDVSLAQFKIPERFHIVSKLPQTAVGKIDRRAARTKGSPTRTTEGRIEEARPEAAANATAEVFDVIGIGFGPANMAVAAALSELPASSAPRALFLDASAGTDWHTGMLLPDAGLQVAFAKDLVTFRNPRSELSFLNFLVTQGRIHDFFNRGSSAPLRVEFAAYLRWAAARLRDYVRYSHRVVSIRPLAEDGTITGYRVDADTPDGLRTFRARDVVLAGGLQAHLPAAFGVHERLLHSSRYLHRIEDLPIEASQPEGPNLVVIGGGQSAAEVALDLRGRYPSARVHLVHSRFGLIPSDATPYANRVFDHSSVDRFFHAPDAVRARLENAHRNTNYSVVHHDTLRALYNADYADSWAGRRRLILHDASRVRAVEPARGDGIGWVSPRLSVTIDHELDDTQEVVEADIVVAATGYRPFDPATLLGVDAERLVRDGQGRVVAARDYRLEWNGPASGRFFALGITGHQHGLASTLLSDIALRAGEIVTALCAGAKTETDATPAAVGESVR